MNFIHLSSLIDDEVEDDYLKWISKQLNMKLSILKQKLEEHNNGFEENRGRRKLTIDTRQKIYDEWLENSIESVDCRSGRQEVRVGKLVYLQKYDDLIHSPPLEEKVLT